MEENSNNNNNDNNNNNNNNVLPPGFRFHPTDEELITYYLTNKVSDFSFSSRAVTDVDLNKCEPWDLPAKASMGEKEWYFFSLRDRKYPTGMRTNRATEAGYWKTTGKDKEIFRGGGGGHLVGMKKTLVFYKGRAPKGEKTNWVMHEYRQEAKLGFKPSKEEWVVCRIFQKSSTVKKLIHQTPSSPNDEYSMDSPDNYNNNNNNCDTNTIIMANNDHHHHHHHQLGEMELQNSSSSSGVGSIINNHNHNINNFISTTAAINDHNNNINVLNWTTAALREAAAANALPSLTSWPPPPPPTCSPMMSSNLLLRALQLSTYHQSPASAALASAGVITSGRSSSRDDHYSLFMQPQGNIINDLIVSSNINVGPPPASPLPSSRVNLDQQQEQPLLLLPDHQQQQQEQPFNLDSDIW